MCGRTSLYADLGLIEERFDAEADFDYRLRYNVAPRQDLATIRNTTEDTITRQNWGLLAPWADDLVLGVVWKGVTIVGVVVTVLLTVAAW